MLQTLYQEIRDEFGLDFLRVRLLKLNGKVIHYTVQYEATINGERMIVVRYDNAHGIPHQDTLNRQGVEVDKTWFPDLSNEQALTDAIEHISTRWATHRAAFIKG